MSTNTLLFGILFFLLAVALFFIVRIELRLRKLFKGNKANTLEELLGNVVKGVSILDERCTVQEQDIKTLEERLAKQGRGVKLTRFNPFGDVGGNQSFAVAFVNKEGDGVVFSSLYSRDRMSVFAKPINKGVSDIELTTEEKAVVEEARKDANQ